MFVCINGKFVDENEAKVSIYDRGFLYGDGIFETLTIVNGKLFWFDEHYARLEQSAKLIRISLPFEKQALFNLLNETLQKNNLKNCRIRLNVTRGECPKPMTAYATCNYHPNYYIIPYSLKLPSEEEYSRGIKVVTINIERFMPVAKTLNFLPSIIAYMTGKEKDSSVDDIIMIQRDGLVTETGNANIFIVKNNVLQTPKSHVLEGVGRKQIINIAKQSSLEVMEKDISLQELLTADEVFLSGSGKRIVPVIEINKKQIGNGKPGKITLSLLKQFKERFY